LATLEIEEIDDIPSLDMLKDYTNSGANVPLHAVLKKVEMIRGRNYTEDIKPSEETDIQMGNRSSETTLVPGIVFNDQI
jgi:hypothetical protein